MQTTLPINEIVIAPDRMRKDLGAIDRLADSIRKFGIIQPLVLDSPKSKNLIAGERRYRACQQIGLEHVKVVYKDDADLPEDIRKELEFEENYQRKAMTWQEEALGILDIYRTKRRKGALEGFKENWTQTVADMFSMSIGTANYVLRVAKKLEAEKNLPKEKQRYHKFSSVNEAYRLGILAEEEDEQNLILAKQTRSTINPVLEEKKANELVQQLATVESSPDALAEERKRYESNPHNTIPFEQYHAERQQKVKEAQNTIYLSPRVLQGDCRQVLSERFTGYFDAIITDPPYAIDMDNLNQNNQHGGLVQLDRVVEAHQVDENTQLLADFFPMAYRVTKDKAFVMVFHDPMMWQFLYDHAIKAGFAVQRWPFIWRKVNQSCMNNMSGYNTTKDFEPVMICRKPSTTLYKKHNTSVQDGSNVEAVKLTDHPFAKPFEVTQTLIEMATMENMEVLDPFAGGGSLVLNFIKNKRKFTAIEKEDHWYNALLERLKQHYLKISPNFVFK